MHSFPPGQLIFQSTLLLLLWFVFCLPQMESSGAAFSVNSIVKPKCNCECTTWLPGAGCRKQAADDKLAEQQLVINHRKRRRTDREASGGGGGGAEGTAGDAAVQVSSLDFPASKDILQLRKLSRPYPLHAKWQQHSCDGITRGHLLHFYRIREPQRALCCQGPSPSDTLLRLVCSHRAPLPAIGVNINMSSIAEDTDQTSLQHRLSWSHLPHL